MFCPICKVTQLVLQNGYTYCPHCKIFIDKVGNRNIPHPFHNQPPPLGQLNPQTVVDKPIKQSIFSKVFRLKFLLIAVVLYLSFSYLSNFFYLDPINNCYIAIGPSWLEFSNSTIKKTLTILKNASPDNYQNVCQRVNFINPNLSCGGFEGGCFNPKSPRSIDVSTSLRMTAYTADVISHEACHARQFYQNRQMLEPECYGVGSDVLKTIVDY